MCSSMKFMRPVSDASEISQASPRLCRDVPGAAIGALFRGRRIFRGSGAARGGVALMPEQNCAPVNRYLPPRPRQDAHTVRAPRMLEAKASDAAGLIARWVDRVLSA